MSDKNILKFEDFIIFPVFPIYLFHSLLVILRNCFTSTKRKLFENLRDKESRKSMENLESEIEESSDCCCSGRRSSSATEEKAKSTTEQPTEAEIEEFFAEAEKQLRDKFEKK